MRSGEPEIEVTVDEARALGLAPSAAATYGIEQGVSIAGYGEMLLENYSSGRTGRSSTTCASSCNAGYRFNEKFIFNSEIEVEHANEIFVEFAYVDWLAHENLGVRGGMLLVPDGARHTSSTSRTCSSAPSVPSPSRPSSRALGARTAAAYTARPAMSWRIAPTS